MANEPTDEDRARELFRDHWNTSPTQSEVAWLAAALAAERARTVERCAKWHEEQRDGRLFQAAGWKSIGWPDAIAEHEYAARLHSESAIAIRALGRGK